ncbi:MAG: hypothetical protein IPP90_03970 [Gemmatimonadaceae bacterium]|nr:hypothetical protein [Gemmatimonadaceae bacterium]
MRAALRDAAIPLMNAARLTAHPTQGAVQVFDKTLRCLVDPLVPPVSLVLVGAGRGAEAFAAIAHTLGWRVTLVDHRPFVVESVSLPERVARIVARADDGIAHVSRDSRTAVALLSINLRSTPNG